MRKSQKGPSINILSFRVDDQDKAILEKISQEANLSISDLLRRTLLEFEAEYRRSQLRDIEETLVQHSLQQPIPELYRFRRSVGDVLRALDPTLHCGSEA